MVTVNFELDRKTMAPTSAVSFTPFAQPVHFCIRDAKIAYEPSVYGGDGTETRVNLTLQCFGEVLEDIRALEGSSDASLISCIKDSGVRAKIDKTTVRVFDKNGSAAPAPMVWRGTRVNAYITAKGAWKTRTGNGVCLECTDLQFLPEAPQVCPF